MVHRQAVRHPRLQRPQEDRLPPWALELECRLQTGRVRKTDRYWVEPANLFVDAGFHPDPWQADLLRSWEQQTLLCCHRQAGKSEVAASLALRTALLEDGSLTLLLSPTLRQSGELFRQKVLPQWRALGCPKSGRPPTALELHLTNGSRIVSLPDNESGIRGFSGVSLLVIDEAARVSDALYCAVRPMLAVSRGRVLALSTPFGKRGWFYEAWRGRVAAGAYHGRTVPTHCPRVPGQRAPRVGRPLVQAGV
jgi:hypothetical protein